MASAKNGDENRKTALNVKIEKLLFLFSWQNIFIAFSSATIFFFPFKWNMMFKCLLYFNPLSKLFSFSFLFLLFFCLLHHNIFLLCHVFKHHTLCKWDVFCIQFYWSFSKEEKWIEVSMGKPIPSKLLADFGKIQKCFLYENIFF